MSDTYIPGVKSKYDTDKLIEGLMKIERVPKERAEKEVETLETQKSVWQDVGRRISTLRESARSLYSYQNPFNERVASSSDEAVLTGSATREATEQERSFLVKQIAGADRFLSKPLAENYRIPEGEYVFGIGQDEVTIPFRGGTIKEFSDAVARRAKDKIAVSTIVVEPKTKSMVFESLVTGAENRLVFKKDAEKLALETGVAVRVDDQERKIAVAGNGDAEKEGTLRVEAGGSAKIPVSPGMRIRDNLSLEAEISVETIKEEARKEEEAPAGPQIPSTGSISYGGIVVESDPSVVPIPKWEKPPAPPRVDDPNVLRLNFSDGSSAFLPPVKDDGGFERRVYRLADFAAPGTDLTGIEVVNRNTGRTVSLRSVRIFDPNAAGGLKAVSPISQARDAVVAMDGIEVKRKKNDIDDLIPGVTVTLRDTSDKTVKLKVEPDRKAAKDAVVSMVGNYNRLIAEINVLTRNDEQLIKELTYLDADERKTMEDRLGTMQGDITLNQIRTNLQRAAASPYQTSADKKLALLGQIGVSTDSRKPGSISGVDSTRLRGYLEIDEKTLDKALQENIKAVKELFGNDTDGDLLMDQGFAYSVDTLSKPFVDTGGIIQMKTGTIDTQIKSSKQRIDTLDRQLAAKEADLKRKYGLMESSLNSMERTSSSIDQFSSNNSK